MRYTRTQRVAEPPGTTGSKREKSMPPSVMASIKAEKTRPVGRGLVGEMRSREGTHINTTNGQAII